MYVRMLHTALVHGIFLLYNTLRVCRTAHIADRDDLTVKKGFKMGNWGDDSDFEVKALKDFEFNFTFNFKKIYMYVDEVSERTLEVNEKHPKDSLMKLWAGTMLGFFIFMLLSYKLLALVMIPFFAFYILALVRIYKCWKGFKYNGLQYWAMSLVTLIAVFALSRVAQYLALLIIG